MKGTVFVVDDDEAVRRSLADIPSAEGLIVHTYETAEELLSACDAQSEGCILLDVRLPGMDGMDTQVALNERGIEMPIIFLTGHGEVQMSVRAMKAGAYDFLQKPVPAEILLSCVKTALILDRRHREKLADRNEACELLARLTAREQEVLHHLLQGASSKEIAKKLHLSPRTVDVHRQNILIKCRVNSLLELSALHRRCNND